MVERRSPGRRADAVARAAARAARRARRRRGPVFRESGERSPRTAAARRPRAARIRGDAAQHGGAAVCGRGEAVRACSTGRDAGPPTSRTPRAAARTRRRRGRRGRRARVSPERCEPAAAVLRPAGRADPPGIDQGTGRCGARAREGPGRSRARERAPAEAGALRGDTCYWMRLVDARVRVVVAVLVDADGRLGRVTVLIEGDRAGGAVVVDLAALGEEGGAVGEGR